ncbi:MAG: AAA family ATPase [Candidatus Tectomicrobia bacterium]|nr:AAA family ATPase [Candidatus Tectomicrobia bacterium]
MIRSLEVKNFTAFSEAQFDFAKGLNVIVGENATGKTHLLKLPYAVMAVSAEEASKHDGHKPTRTILQPRIAEKIVNVFRPDESRLGRLTRRRQGRNRCEVKVNFRQPGASVGFNFASQNKSEVVIDRLPSKWVDRMPVFLPPRELLSIYPGFASLYERHYLEFEETWHDTCVLLGLPLQKGPRDRDIRKLLVPLEDQIGQVVERNGRFYLRRSHLGNMEMPLVAEGWRKLAMLARLIATGSLDYRGALFWDEPESNLNPKLIREVAKAILRVCGAGAQVFVATHSLFLFREFEILLNSGFAEVEARYFALRQGDDGVEISQSDEVDAIKPLLILDEELEQSDRFLEKFMS